jgi:SSS family solute:Na+ symporter
MATLDWMIVLGVLLSMISAVTFARSYSRNVVDFLAAGRTAGRYVLTLSQGVSEVGAISVIGWLEMNYVAGFPQSWWGLTMGVVILILTVTGWVVYRFRRTRSLTLAEFFERRYSKNFRIFAGGLAFLSGLINFGIFPAVGARFFIYFCDLPRAVSIVGFDVSTYPLVMIALLGTALFFVFSGGQVAVILADFIQGLFVNVVFVVIAVYVIWVVEWNPIFETLATAPQEQSLINPFKTSHVDDFNLAYFVIGVIGVIYISCDSMNWFTPDPHRFIAIIGRSHIQRILK